jgi:hypothetical protein
LRMVCQTGSGMIAVFFTGLLIVHAASVNVALV